MGQVSSLEMRGLKTLEETVQFQTEIQEKVMALSEHRIPAIFHMEGLCGAYLQGATSFPTGISRGSTWNPELEEEVGRVVARQREQLGYPILLHQYLIYQETHVWEELVKCTARILH